MNEISKYTSALEVGDVVLVHGMRVLVESLERITNHPGDSDQSPVYAGDGRVLNADEATASGAVPRSWLAQRDQRGTPTDRMDYWRIQGNDLRRWTVEA